MDIRHLFAGTAHGMSDMDMDLDMDMDMVHVRVMLEEHVWEAVSSLCRSGRPPGPSRTGRRRCGVPVRLAALHLLRSISL